MDRLEVQMKEYEKLKAEQTARIGFRDNMVYINLAAVGAVFAFALSSASNYSALLVIPWVCVVLGWTYIVNDEKISAIGEYIRKSVETIACEDLSLKGKLIFGWEVAHRSDPWRYPRKLTQLCIDELTFVAPGVVAIVGFTLEKWPLTTVVLLLVAGEVVMLLGLAIIIAWQTDIRVGQ